MNVCDRRIILSPRCFIVNRKQKFQEIERFWRNHLNYYLYRIDCDYYDFLLTVPTGSNELFPVKAYGY